MSQLVVDALRDIDPTIPVEAAVPMSVQLARSVAAERIVTVLLLAFGGAALLLACTGIYGLVAYSVQRQTREIGLRMALGASRGRVWTGVLVNAMALGGSGIALGLLGGLGLARLLRGLLYGVTSHDPGTLVAVALLVLSVVGVASLAPALRAARVDPFSAIRES